MYVARDLLVVKKQNQVYSYVHNIDLFVDNAKIKRYELEPVDLDRSIYAYLTAKDLPKPIVRSLLFPAAESLTPLQAFSYDYELPDDYYELLGVLNAV